MSDQEALNNLLSKLDRLPKLKQILASPQTELDNEKLISLDLSDIRIKEVPEDLFKELPDLERIHLSFNELAELPEGIFNGMKNLKFINLYRNEIKALPDNIFDGLENLEWLDLRSNGLEVLPKSLAQLKNLEYLYLQNNPLSEHEEHNWAADYHSKRDVDKFLPEFAKEMGL